MHHWRLPANVLRASRLGAPVHEMVASTQRSCSRLVPGYRLDVDGSERYPDQYARFVVTKATDAVLGHAVGTG